MEAKADKLLHKLYYDIKENDTAFSSKNNVYRQAKKQLPDLKRRHVDKWFEKQLTYTLHKPIRYNFKRNKIMVKGIDYQWQADLCDMSSLKAYNNNKTFLLTCIDCFSKYAWVQPLSNKSGIEIIKAFKKIITRTRKPESLQTDKGTEFLNKPFQLYLRKQNIHFFTTNSEMKAAIVERFNRTLKSRMYKYFTASNTLHYLNVLQNLVKAYNNSVHRSIGMKPAAVTSADEHKIRRKLYPSKLFSKTYKYSIGDLVRISKARRTFKKGYLPSWTEESFVIYDRIIREQPNYYLKDHNNEKIKGLFYEKELQRVSEQDKYRVERVIKKKRQKDGKTLYFVKWKGYDDTFNSWVEDIERL